jgi:hypothetical protein
MLSRLSAPTPKFLNNKFIKSPLAILPSKTTPLDSSLASGWTRVDADAVGVDLTVLQLPRHVEEARHVVCPHWDNGSGVGLGHWDC